MFFIIHAISNLLDIIAVRILHIFVTILDLFQLITIKNAGRF